MKFFDKVQLVFGNNFESYMEEYRKDFLSGNDVTTGPASVSAQSALKYSAVWACCRVLGETLASMPIMLYRRDKDTNERDAVRDLRIYDILHNAPNEEMSAGSFKEAGMMNLNLGGNFVAQRLKNSKGHLLGLKPYRWQNVIIDRNKTTKKLQYTIRNGKDGTNKLVLERKDVVHIPGLTLDGIIGMSPITYASRTIGLGVSYDKFSENLYKNSVNSPGAFTVPNEMKEPAYKRLKANIKTNYAGLKNTGTPMLLEGGMEFKAFAIKPADAQLLESKKFQVEDVARIYRVPPHMIGDLSRSTNNNIEHQSLEFVMYTMLPWFKRWESAINQQLLTKAERKAGYYMEFNMTALLRGDLKTRAEHYASARTSGYMSVNDIRKLENMKGIGPKGDIYIQPLNYAEAGTVSDTDNSNAKLIDSISDMIKKNKE